jgi:hypothetical protein
VCVREREREGERERGRETVHQKVALFFFCISTPDGNGSFSPPAKAIKLSTAVMYKYARAFFAVNQFHPSSLLWQGREPTHITLSTLSVSAPIKLKVTNTLAKFDSKNFYGCNVQVS